MKGSGKKRGNATETMTETGIETGIETEIETGTEIEKETEIEIGTGIGIEKETGTESLTKLHAAQRDGGDAPLRHPHPMRGARDALRNGKQSLVIGTSLWSVLQAQHNPCMCLVFGLFKV